MEEDRRKKKNKKKKNKQATILTESVTVDAGEPISDNQSHVPEIEQGKAAQVSGNTDASNDVGRKMGADRDDHLSNGIEETHIAKADKQNWLDTEASCQEKIKQLQAEKDAQIQKEAILELKIHELLKENDEILQKLACQEEIIKQLRDEKIASTQKEASLKEKVEQLEKEKDTLIRKEDSLHDMIKQLQMEKDVYLQTENLAKELIAVLNSDNTKLEAQVKKEVPELRIKKRKEELVEFEVKKEVPELRIKKRKEELVEFEVMELEELGKSLLEEKQELTESISSLQLQINNVGSTVTFPNFNMDNKPPEDGNMGNQVEIAHALVEKLVPENAALVDMGSDPGAVAARFADVTDRSDFTHNFAFGAETNIILIASSSTQSLEEFTIEDGRINGHVNDKDGYGLPNSSGDIIKPDEIVQISLNESEVEDTNLEVAAQNDEKTDVPFTDAPLIGAPFRLISFVARYVSGADLVNKNTGNSGL